MTKPITIPGVGETNKTNLQILDFENEIKNASPRDSLGMLTMLRERE
jgi:hypothetical protein